VAASGYDDLRPSHGNVMEQFAFNDGLRLTDLAAGAGMTAQSMSELVDDLERKGYVERRPDPSDRRAKRIYVTEKGQENIRVSIQAVANVEERLLAALGRERYDEVRNLVEAIIATERDRDR
jgi:DNA-binding MarR family transcriptional regulator